MTDPHAKCEHEAFKNLDGIAPCYHCHPEFKPSDFVAKARVIRDFIIENCINTVGEWCDDECGKRGLEFISTALELERKAGREEMREECSKHTLSILEAEHKAYRRGMEEAAQIADRYEDQIDGTQDFRNGWRQSAEAIEEAIRQRGQP